MRAKGYLRWLGIGAFIIAVVIVGFRLRYPPDPLIYCQKQISSAVDMWMLNEGTNVYPNINGDGEASLRFLCERYIAYATMPRDYGYVPGIKYDDPDDLVFMYLKRKTRRTWDGDHSPTFFSPKRWMVLPPMIWHTCALNSKPDYIPDPENYSQVYAEGGLLVDTPEFKRRLTKTLKFLEENNRPYWTNVVKEHSQFINSIKE